MVIALAYIAASAGAGVAAATFGLAPAPAVGLPIAAASVLVHLLAAQRLRARRFERGFRELARRFADLQEQLQITRADLETMRARVDSMPDAEKLSGELKVLHGLLKQFADRRVAATAGKPAPAKAVAPTPTAPATGGQPVVTLDDDDELLSAIETALRDERVELYLQPVVSLPQRKRQFYECFSRIALTDGGVISPEQYIPVAERAGLVAAIDNLLLVRCVQLVRRARRDHLDVGFFCNISNASLTDVDFFQDFIAFMAENRQLAETLIFEFDQPSIAAGDYVTRMNLERLRGCGYRFSLDQVTDLDVDLEDLASQGFRYLKLNAHLLHEMARGEDPVLDMRSFKGALDRSAMDLIVEKIESEDMLLDLLELKVDFGQGFLFGEPRPLVQDPQA